ncbi:MAG: hypothetical protein IKT57_01080 [Clostridia bacterium]|nr:hypothetical protein [Clostridia bacterium]
MAKTIKEKNQMECNKRAREKYEEKNFKHQTVKFKIAELDMLNDYCSKNKIPKNTVMRTAIMQYIEQNSEK